MTTKNQNFVGKFMDLYNAGAKLADYHNADANWIVSTVTAIDPEADPEEVAEMAAAVIAAAAYDVNKSQFGEVSYKGESYALTDQAVISNRQFVGWFGDAAEGEKYTTEYQANAIDKDGYSYRVMWQFEVVKGQEPEDESDYPWDDEHVTRVDMQ